MTGPVLIPCLRRLRAEFDVLAPGRSRASDGWIGDTAHQAEVSDHNDDEVGRVPIHDADSVHEVHAVDVDSDLRRPGVGMEDVVQLLLARCRSGAETRLRYIIYRRRIWAASSGWRERPYNGPSPHEEHAHFSGSYDSDREADTSPWHLEELDVGSVWAEDVQNPAWSPDAAAHPKVPAGVALTRTLDMAHSAAVHGDRANKTLALVLAQLTALAGRDLVDEPAIVAGVLAGLSPAAIAAAIPQDIALQVVDEIGRRVAKPGVTFG